MNGGTGGTSLFIRTSLFSRGRCSHPLLQPTKQNESPHHPSIHPSPALNDVPRHFALPHRRRARPAFTRKGRHLEYEAQSPLRRLAGEPRVGLLPLPTPTARSNPTSPRDSPSPSLSFLSLSPSLFLYRRDISASQSQFPCSCLYHIAILPSGLVHDCCFYCLVLFSVHTLSNLYAFFSWWASYIPRSLKSVSTA